MDTVNLKVKGMSCTNCALTIHKYLEQQGLQNIKVNFIAGDVSFDPDENICPASWEPCNPVPRGNVRLAESRVAPSSC
jgi:copper chaperone CopZ